MLFSGLSEKINHVFSKLTKRGKLTELEIKEAMREVRVALLEADVNFLVVKNFIKSVTEKAVGERVMKSLTPGQQIIKIVDEELTELLGSNQAKLNISANPPSKYMLCGLQGAGKTTMCGKLAAMLKKQGKKVLIVALDIYRPAAITQLKVLCDKVGVELFEKGQNKVVATAKEALKHAKKYMFDVVIFDTAGRLQIDESLMTELKDLKKEIDPNEILFTIDSMTGQEGVNVAKAFDEDLDITGVILTKLDGDTRGGVALSIKSVVNKPIKFTGVGEKVGDIEPFYPDRIASRILGKGDVLSLIEKAQAQVSEEEQVKLAKKFKENKFDFEDYLSQFESMKNMGGINDILSMVPGMGAKMKNMGQIDERSLDKNKAIIQSMTIYERRNPEVIKGSHKKRIAAGSGTSIQEVNQLLKQFEQTKTLMKQMKGRGRLPF